MQKLLTFFSAKLLAYMPYLMIKILTMLTNDNVSFEQLGPEDLEWRRLDDSGHNFLHFFIKYISTH